MLNLFLFLPNSQFLSPFETCLLAISNAVVNMAGQDCYFRPESDDYTNTKTVQGHIPTLLLQTQVSLSTK